jgi:hypothetical protein
VTRRKGSSVSKSAGGVVKSDVAVLPDADEGHVHWGFGYLLREGLHVLLDIALPVDEMDPAGVDLRDEPLMQVPAEACSVIFWESDVLVQVEHLYFCPVHRLGDEFPEGSELGCSRGEHQPGPSLFLHGFPEKFTSPLRRSGGEFVGRIKNENVHCFSPEGYSFTLAPFSAER